MVEDLIWTAFTKSSPGFTTCSLITTVMPPSNEMVVLGGGLDGIATGTPPMLSVATPALPVEPAQVVREVAERAVALTVAAALAGRSTPQRHWPVPPRIRSSPPPTP